MSSPNDNRVRRGPQERCMTMQQFATSLSLALVWLDPPQPETKPKPRASSIPTCARPGGGIAPRADQTKDRKERS